MEIKQQWEKINKKYCNSSDIVCFEKLIIANNFEESEIRKLFRKLVNKKEYEKSQLENLIKWFNKL